jgi:hypothetical protein
VPRGRLAEDGEIPVGYPHLVEAEDAEPNTRTTLNIRDSDATLILSQGELHGGSKFTASTALKAGKPYLHVDLARRSVPDAVRDDRRVAGPRAKWLLDDETGTGGTVALARPVTPCSRTFVSGIQCAGGYRAD